MKNTRNKLSIKSWAKVDRPREKLILKGKSALSEAELIAILIGSGNRHESAVELSRRILGDVENNLASLSRLSVNDLMQFKGIGEAKAISIVAALELGRRRKESAALNKERISSSRDLVRIFQPLLADLSHEEFWVLFLNRSNKIISRVNISSGGVSGTVVDSKIIFKLAVEHLASSVILCHNHPSGNVQPSEADIMLTKSIRDAGKLLDVVVLDHIIIAEDRHFSFADEGLI